MAGETPRLGHADAQQALALSDESRSDVVRYLQASTMV